MTNLTSQRRLASDILKVGLNRVWIDPARVDDVEGAITREEIRKLIHEKIITRQPEKSVSRSRAKTIQEKKRKGRRLGRGLAPRYGGRGLERRAIWRLSFYRETPLHLAADQRAVAHQQEQRS